MNLGRTGDGRLCRVRPVLPGEDSSRSGRQGAMAGGAGERIWNEKRLPRGFSLTIVRHSCYNGTYS